MKLNDVLFKEFKKEVYLFDVNNNAIVSGEPLTLFDVLDYYFLNLDVISINGCNITVDYKLGGDE